MKFVMKNCIYLGERVNEFVDRETGEAKTYAKVTLMQEDDSEPVELSLDDSLLGSFCRFESYDLLVRVSTFNKKFTFKVIGIE